MQRSFQSAKPLPLIIQYPNILRSQSNDFDLSYFHCCKDYVISTQMHLRIPTCPSPDLPCRKSCDARNASDPPFHAARASHIFFQCQNGRAYRVGFLLESVRSQWVWMRNACPGLVMAHDFLGPGHLVGSALACWSFCHYAELQPKGKFHPL